MVALNEFQTSICWMSFCPTFQQYSAANAFPVIFTRVCPELGMSWWLWTMLFHQVPTGMHERVSEVHNAQTYVLQFYGFLD